MSFSVNRVDEQNRTGAAPHSAAHNWARTAVAASSNGTGVAIAGRVDRSAVPQTRIEVGFADLIDVVNPLQHIPVVSELYRQITGDEIKGFARVAGGALFGGVLGAAAGAVAAAWEENNDGKTIPETLIAALTGPDKDVSAPAPAPAAIRVAQQDRANPEPGSNILLARSEPEMTKPIEASPVVGPSPTVNPGERIAAPKIEDAMPGETLRDRFNRKHGPLLAQTPTPSQNFLDRLPKVNRDALERLPSLPPLPPAPSATPAIDSSPKPTPVTPKETKSTPAPFALAPQAPSMPPAQIADLMARALDKYRARAAQR